MLHLLTTLATIVLAIAAGLLVLPALSEVVSLLSPARPPRPAVPSATPRLLFLVPAHDEATLIGPCVSSLVAMDYPVAQRRIIVVADNCQDETAGLARTHGAEALERTDLALPGKPRALAWALEQLRDDPWEACVIVDADTTVDPGFASALAAEAPLTDIAVQAYFGTLNEWDTWLTRLAGVLARSRYEVSYPLKQRVGLNCPLTGNGMCLGRTLLKDGWQAFSLTENWELYASLTAHGTPIRYSRRALLLSQEVQSMGQGGTQRRRWLAGRIGVLRAWGPRILASATVGWRQKLDALVELGGPSPVLHLVAAVAVAALSLLLVGGPAGGWIAGLAAASLLGHLITTVSVLLRHPEPGRTLLAFVMLPVYAIWRTSTAVWTLLSLRDTVWRKTSR